MLRVLELSFFIVLFVTVTTQVLIPLWDNEKTFPLFRRKK